MRKFWVPLVIFLFFLFQTFTGFNTYQKDRTKSIEFVSPAPVQIKENQLYPVVRVVDGDTIDVNVDSSIQKFDLLGSTPLK